jgi:hypothetical protein
MATFYLSVDATMNTAHLILADLVRPSDDEAAEIESVLRGYLDMPLLSVERFPSVRRGGSPLIKQSLDRRAAEVTSAMRARGFGTTVLTHPHWAAHIEQWP